MNAASSSGMPSARKNVSASRIVALSISTRSACRNRNSSAKLETVTGLNFHHAAPPPKSRSGDSSATQPALSASRSKPSRRTRFSSSFFKTLTSGGTSFRIFSCSSSRCNALEISGIKPVTNAILSSRSLICGKSISMPALASVNLLTLTSTKRISASSVLCASSRISRSRFWNAPALLISASR